MSNNKNKNHGKNTITVFMPSLGGGGAEKIVIRLLHGFLEKGLKVVLILATPHGNLHTEIPENVKIVNLNCKRTIYSIYKLTKYLNKNKPRNLLSHLDRANRIAILSALLSSSDVKVHIVEHNTMSIARTRYSLFNRLLLSLSYRFLYPKSASVIHVSKAAANDLKNILGHRVNKVEYIYNPIVDREMIEVQSVEPPHEWFKSQNIPVILGVGRLSEQKDFVTLINAFSILRNRIDSRLIILGEGEQRAILERKIIDDSISEYVSLPGFVRNPLAYMKHARLFVLSSKWEALPTVLVEALACGCPVVSTDCPSGPSEILQNGKYGALVPVNSPKELAAAIEATLKYSINKDLLIKRALEFSIERAVNRYLEVIAH
jgi:glycosyltransferase involved in cell wall biosynthesis